MKKKVQHFWNKVKPRKFQAAEKVSDEDDRVLCHSDVLNEETTNTASRWDDIELISSSEISPGEDRNPVGERKVKTRKRLKKRVSTHARDKRPKFDFTFGLMHMTDALVVE